jgi:hypothetical protein
MIQSRKTRIPSVPYLEMKITEMGAIAKPTKDEILLLAQYKILMEQRMK